MPIKNLFKTYQKITFIMRQFIKVFLILFGFVLFKKDLIHVSQINHYFKEFRMLKSKILKDEFELKYFKKRAFELIGVNFPDSYFEQGFIRGIYYKNRIIGGYALITNGPFRTVRSLPDHLDHGLMDSELFEITALWVEPKITSGIPSCYLWYHFSKDILSLRGKKYTIYAYDLCNTKLGKLYSFAKPTEIYRGTVKMLEGNDKENEEIVEIASRYRVGLLPFLKFPNFCCKLFFKRKSHLSDMPVIRRVVGLFRSGALN